MVDESYFDKPCWVIDFLPERVPADGQGRFFEVEANYLLHKNYVNIRKKFSAVVLKLYCYYEVEVYENYEENGEINPDPAMLEWTINSNGYDLSILFGNDEGLMTISIDDTHMTLYASSERLFSLTERIAQSEGLFMWQPDEEKEG